MSGPSLLARVRRVATLPPPDFDPSAASSGQLAGFLLPPRPDQRRQPKLFDAWNCLFAPPVRFVELRLAQVELKFQLNPRVAQPRPLTSGFMASRDATSANWSGAFVVPSGGNMVVFLSGEWVVPTPALPQADLIPSPSPGAQYACSTWLGLDGQRRYLNASLPQIGTTQTLTFSDAARWETGAFAWFQWWERDGPISFIPLDGLPVAPGDRVAAAIWVSNPNQVVAYIRNLQTNQLAVLTADSPTVSVNGNAVRLAVSGATAEWILERPTRFGGTDLFPFPNYGVAEFRNCVAGTAPQPGGAQDAEDLF